MSNGRRWRQRQRCDFSVLFLFFFHSCLATARFQLQIDLTKKSNNKYVTAKWQIAHTHTQKTINEFKRNVIINVVLCIIIEHSRTVPGMEATAVKCKMIMIIANYDWNTFISIISIASARINGKNTKAKRLNGQIGNTATATAWAECGVWSLVMMAYGIFIYVFYMHDAFAGN